MIVRRGVQSMLRSGKLSILMFLLISLLSLILTLGAGIFSCAEATLDSFEETYRTVGRIEYIGSDYPDETSADPYAKQAYESLDMESILHTDGIISAEKKHSYLGYTEGFKRFGANIPYKDYAVLIVQSPRSLPEEAIEVPVDGIPALEDICIITDAMTKDVTVRYHGIEETVPAFFYDSYNDAWSRITFENGIPVTSDIEKEDLPENYIEINRYRGTVTPHYSGQVSIDDHEIPHYIYNSLQDSWAQEVYAVTEYTCILKDALYSRNEERHILIRLKTGILPEELDSKRTYAVHGSFIDAETSNLVFEVREFRDDETNPIHALDETGTESLKGTPFEEAADFYRYANNYLNVHESSDISLLEEFHQGWLTLESGRFPKEKEDGVCVIDHILADQLQLSVGDQLPLKALQSSADDIYFITGTEETVNYEITGICSQNNDYRGEVFISSSHPKETEFFGSSLGWIRFDNASAASAAETIRSTLGDHVRLTLYDQGYETNSMPLKALQTTSLIITLISSLTALTVLILFAFLAIYRRRDTISVLHQLGLKRSGIAVWMLSGILTIVLAGSLTGCALGSVLMRMILSLTLDGTSSFYAADTRYSSAVTGLVKTIEPVYPSSILILLICTAAVTAASFLLSLLFLIPAMNQNRPSRGKLRLKVPEDTTSLKGNGILRYGRIGFERGGSRSAAVILSVFALSLLLCGFSALSSGWQDELEELYDSSEITGSIVSLNGRYSTGLVISEDTVRRFNQSGLISEFHVAFDQAHYWLADEIPLFAPTSYGEESRQAWIGQQPSMIFVDSLQAAQDFFYSDAAVTWIEGYDETVLGKSLGTIYSYIAEDKPFPALVPDRWLREHNWKAGDVITVMMSGDTPADLLVAGTYSQVSSKANIYLPLCAVYDPADLLKEKEQDNMPWHMNSEQIFTSGVFRLKSAHVLKEFKDFLQKNRYSQVNQPAYDRTTVLIQDASFLDTLGTLSRHIAFADIIYPVLMGFTILAGFLISWLMINGRRMDFAVMKGLGTGKRKVFMIFFLEQAWAALIGLWPVLILSFFIGSPWIIGFFGLSWLMGTAWAVHVVSKENLMVLLSEKE